MPRNERELSGLPRSLREDVRLLGGLLGRVIGQHRGAEFVDRIETIRALAKRARAGRSADWNRLSAYLAALPEQMLTDIARAFNQFLNLANIADQRHAARQATWPKSVDVDQLATVRVELVLTAHPTEVLRRTLIQKYDAIATLLEAREHLPREERSHLEEQLERLIAEAWHTDEIRRERPVPEDEAKWGFAVIETPCGKPSRQPCANWIDVTGDPAAPRHAIRLRVLDGRRPRRQPKRDSRRNARGAAAGALDGGRSVPARRGSA